MAGIARTWPGMESWQGVVRLTWKEHREELRQDRRISGGMGHWKYYFLNDGYKVVSHYRLYRFLMEKARGRNLSAFIFKPVFLAYRLVYHKFCARYGCEIPGSTKIGKSLVIFHPFGVIINANSVIGDYVDIGAHAILGQKDFKNPVIGSNVSIGANAAVIGGGESG